MSKNAILYNPRTLLGGGAIAMLVKHTLFAVADITYRVLTILRTLEPSIPTTKGATPICLRKGKNYFSNTQVFQVKKASPKSMSDAFDYN